jgi:hypothetical protein
MLMFAVELARRSRANGWGLLSVAAHPGTAHTNLQITGPRDGKSAARGGWDLTRLFMSIPGLAQSAADGALPTLRAATGADVQSGDYLGPSRNFGLIGSPTLIRMPGRAADADVARALWSISAQLTGVTWPDTAFPQSQAA